LDSLPDHCRRENGFSQFRNVIQSWDGSKCHCSDSVVFLELLRQCGIFVFVFHFIIVKSRISLAKNTIIKIKHTMAITFINT
jgi:hypothetical protein